MKNNKFWVVITCILLLVGGAWVSCSKNNNSIDIEVYTLSLQGQDEILKNVFDEFRKDNPNVNLEVVIDGHESWKTKIKVLQTSGDLPEIFTTQPSDMAIYASSGIYKDITPWLEEDLAWSENFHVGAFKAVSFDGKVYAVPEQTYSEGIYYNTKILKKLNVSIPTTYKELLEAVKVISKSEYIPMLIGGKDGWPVSMTTQYLMDREVGYSYFEKSNTDINLSVDIQGYQDAFAKFIELNNENAFGKASLSQSYNDAKSLFLQGRAASVIDGSWSIPEFLTQDSSFVSNIVYRNFPKIEGGKGIQNAAVVGYGKSFAVSGKITSEQEPYVKDILKRLTSAKIANIYIEKELLKPFKPDSFDKSKVSKLLQDSLNMVSNADETWPAYGELITPGYYDVLNKIGQSILAGDITSPEQATQRLEEGRVKFQIKKEK